CASGGQGRFLKKLPLSVKHPQKLLIKKTSVTSVYSVAKSLGTFIMVIMFISVHQRSFFVPFVSFVVILELLKK
ncbi:MAG: hypothetical protein JSV88_33210, partial [Candidatus Aminicenantes bacterium]